MSLQNSGTSYTDRTLAHTRDEMREENIGRMKIEAECLPVMVRAEVDPEIGRGADWCVGGRIAKCLDLVFGERFELEQIVLGRRYLQQLLHMVANAELQRT